MNDNSFKDSSGIYKCNKTIPLGEGSFGIVLKCVSENNIIALKFSTNIN